jgi:phage-related protein
MKLKPLVWTKASKRAIKAFPKEARWQAGAEFFRVQEGKQPTDWKPMPSIGSGVNEIRIHEPHEHRTIYVAKFPEAVYVLHCFEKKTQRTSQRDINIARSAYVEMQKRRRNE